MLFDPNRKHGLPLASPISPITTVHPGPIGAAEAPRLCFLVYRFPPDSGGAEVQSQRLARELVRLGAKVMVLTQSSQGCPREERVEGVWIHRMNPLGRRLKSAMLRLRSGSRNRKDSGDNRALDRSTHRSKTATLFVRLAFMAKSFPFLVRFRNEYDIIYVQQLNWTAGFAAAVSTLLGKKVVGRESSTGVNLSVLDSFPLPRSWVKSADAVVATTSWIESELLSHGFPREKLKRIPNGVQLRESVWRPPIAPHPKVAFVGNLGQQPFKGVDLLLRAWMEVVREIPDARLLLAGAPDQGQMPRLAKTLGIAENCKFLGSVGDVQSLLLECDCFVLPSRLEGMSNALLEAMALGIPSVSTAVSGSTDLIVDGRNGFLVPIEDSSALAQAILKAIRSPNRETIGRNAREDIRNYCSIGTIASQYRALYLELAPPIPKASHDRTDK